MTAVQWEYRRLRTCQPVFFRAPGGMQHSREKLFMAGRMMSHPTPPRKAGHFLIPRTCEITWPGEVRLQMELSLLISRRWQEECISCYPGGPSAVTGCFDGEEEGRGDRNRDKTSWEGLDWPRLAVKMGGAREPRHAGSFWKLEKAKDSPRAFLKALPTPRF